MSATSQARVSLELTLATGRQSRPVGVHGERVYGAFRLLLACLSASTRIEQLTSRMLDPVGLDDPHGWRMLDVAVAGVAVDVAPIDGVRLR